MNEVQITHGNGGRILTNTGVWSPDSRFIVYDTRSDAEGTLFDGDRIEIVDTETGTVQTVYQSQNGAHCGVPTFHPTENKVVFILGPEHPTSDWQYGPAHRQGVIVDIAQPGVKVNLDARDLTPPFTRGALRGGSHVHVYSPDGQYVSFTYNDATLSQFAEATPDNDIDQRNVGVCSPLPPSSLGSDFPLPSSEVGGEAAVEIVTNTPSPSEGRGKSEPSEDGGRGERNHPGTAFSVLVTRTFANPAPGSDQIQRAYEEGWVGVNGYQKTDKTHQKRALAFLGEVISRDGKPLSEVFIVDLPDDLTISSDEGPLEGTETRRPLPPRGTMQRRLTFTSGRKFPGVQGPRHWVRSSPEGSQIAFLMRDDTGIAQLWTVSPNGGAPHQVTQDAWGVASAFTWNPNGKWITYVADNSVFRVEMATGQTHRLTPRSADDDAPLPLACVFAPDGQKIAYQRRLRDSSAPDALRHNQIFVLHTDSADFG